MNPQLQSKLKRFVRMIFQDISVNYYSSPKLWEGHSVKEETVAKWTIPLQYSNAGTLQLICVGIESFGRLIFGLTDQERVAKKSFTNFLRIFFPAAYTDKSEEIYECYRCGLLHSHYLGYASSQNGILPTRDIKPLFGEHLHYSNLSAKQTSRIKTTACFRLVLNVDNFYKDFKDAVEKYVAATSRGETRQTQDGSVNLLTNLELSLKNFPVDDDYEYSVSSSEKYSRKPIDTDTSSVILPPLQSERS